MSDHPEGRFAANGALTHEFLDSVPWDDYFGPGSPLERLLDGGRILRLGADLDTVTALHHAEYRCSVWPKRRVRRYRLVSAHAGPTIRAVECLDDEEGLVDYADEDYFADLLRDYLATGRVPTGSWVAHGPNCSMLPTWSLSVNGGSTSILMASTAR